MRRTALHGLIGILFDGSRDPTVHRQIGSADHDVESQFASCLGLLLADNFAFSNFSATGKRCFKDLRLVLVGER